MKKVTEIKLIEKWVEKNDTAYKIYTVSVDGIPQYNPFEDLEKAKAAAFDQVLLSQINGTIYASYLSV